MGQERLVMGERRGQWEEMRPERVRSRQRSFSGPWLFHAKRKSLECFEQRNDLTLIFKKSGNTSYLKVDFQGAWWKQKSELS